MAIIPPPPKDISDCAILTVLRRISNEHDGLAVKAQQFISVATPMLDLIASGPFRDYTLHNRDHAKKLLHLAEYLVPENTINALSALECVFFIYAVFLHDMGMALTSTERNRILDTPAFQDSVRNWPELSNAISRARERLLLVGAKEKAHVETMLFQLHEAALCEYLRPRHATADRYRELIARLKEASQLQDLFSFRGISFEDWLIDICVSHNLGSAVLGESASAYEDRFPRDLAIGQESVNTQFCAGVLRLTDVLDFDRERTPRILFESLGISAGELPGAEVSLREWQKHMAVHTIDVRSDEIVVSAECHHPAIEKAIREFCSLIERELRDTVAVVNRNAPATLARYQLDLPLTVRPRIKSIGYKYWDVSLRLNQSAIISLLMGEKLYSKPRVALRELIQNALDACDARRRSEVRGNYVARIDVTSDVDSDGERWIQVSDNGIGMDEHVLGEYFLKLGDSYYDSSEFKRHLATLQSDAVPFRPISRFGIGILSVFMLGDVLEVRTRSAFSPRGDHEPRLIRIEKLGGLAFVAKSDRSVPGTAVRIRLRSDVCAQYEEFARDASKYLRWLLLRPQILVHVDLGADARFCAPPFGSTFYSVSETARKALAQEGYELISIQLSRWSDSVSGVVVALLWKDANGQLSGVKDGQQLTFQQNVPNAVNPSLIVRQYPGNRLSVNGIRVTTFRTRNLLRFSSGLKLACLADIDACGGDEVEFDVSRERLTERGDRYLRTEIQTAVLNALSETGVLDRFTPELRLALTNIPRRVEELRVRLAVEDSRPDALRFLFDAVATEIPADHWPRGMHHEIANRLGISPNLVGRVIAGLIACGRVSNPNAAAQVDGSLPEVQTKKN